MHFSRNAAPNSPDDEGAVMNFGFDETEQEFQNAIRRFALERMLPEYASWERGRELTRAWTSEIAELGLTGLRVPEQYGGVGASYVMAGIAAEELARGDLNMTFYIQLSAIAAELIGGHGSNELKSRLLPQLASGETLLAFALTEPGAGSDAAAITTRAVHEDDTWVITGEKASISFAGVADQTIVFARMSKDGQEGLGALIVPMDSPGVSVRVYDGVGEKFSKRGSVMFDEVRVARGQQLGEIGSGFIQAMKAFDFNRAIIALTSIGAAQQSLDETVAYARERKTFGKPLAMHQGYAFQIAEHSAHLETARLVAYKTLWLADHGLPHTKEAAMAKWLGPKCAAEAIHACMILNGWMGYDEALAHGQRLRDVIGFEIGDGTPEIMKSVIARQVFGREFASHK